MSKRHPIALTLMASALIASGCGGSSKSSSQTASATQAASSTQATATTTQTQPVSAGPPLTRAELIAKADLVCARLNAIRASNVVKSKQEFIQSISRLSGDEQRTLEEMAKLTPPATLANTWSSILTGYRMISENVNKLKQDLARNKTGEVDSLLASSNQIQHNTAAIAKSAGFKDCGKRL
jgi:hypothetical protein